MRYLIHLVLVFTFIINNVIKNILLYYELFIFSLYFGEQSNNNLQFCSELHG